MKLDKFYANNYQIVISITLSLLYSLFSDFDKFQVVEVFWLSLIALYLQSLYSLLNSKY